MVFWSGVVGPGTNVELSLARASRLALLRSRLKARLVSKSTTMMKPVNAILKHEPAHVRNQPTWHKFPIQSSTEPLGLVTQCSSDLKMGDQQWYLFWFSGFFLSHMCSKCLFWTNYSSKAWSINWSREVELKAKGSILSGWRWKINDNNFARSYKERRSQVFSKRNTC